MGINEKHLGIGVVDNPLGLINNYTLESATVSILDRYLSPEYFDEEQISYLINDALENMSNTPDEVIRVLFQLATENRSREFFDPYIYFEKVMNILIQKYKEDETVTVNDFYRIANTLKEVEHFANPRNIDFEEFQAIFIDSISTSEMPKEDFLKMEDMFYGAE